MAEDIFRLVEDERLREAGWEPITLHGIEWWRKGGEAVSRGEAMERLDREKKEQAE